MEPEGSLSSITAQCFWIQYKTEQIQKYQTNLSTTYSSSLRSTQHWDQLAVPKSSRCIWSLCLGIILVSICVCVAVSFLMVFNFTWNMQLSFYCLHFVDLVLWHPLEVLGNVICAVWSLPFFVQCWELSTYSMFPSAVFLHVPISVSVNVCLSTLLSIIPFILLLRL
jgi:hypothetical protein